MTIDLTTPGLLFPAISLLFLSYTNRHLALGARIRNLHSDLLKNTSPGGLKEQIANLDKRLLLIRWMQVSGACSLCCSVLSMALLMIDMQTTGVCVFFTALIFMMISLVLLVIETTVSGGALKVMLEQASIPRNTES